MSVRRRFWTFWLAVGWAVSTVLFGASASAESIAGESLIEQAGAVEEVIEALMQQPVSRSEVYRFVSEAEVVLEWTLSNVDQWVAADESDSPLPVIRAFEVWSRIDSPAAAFVATLVKLMLARDFSNEEVSTASLEKEIAEMERIVKSGKLSGYVLEMARTEIAEKRETLQFLRGVAPQNQKLYKASRERIDPVLDRFEQIGR